MTIAMAEIILTNFGCPGLAGDLWLEHEDMSKSWARKIAIHHHLKFTFPEAIDTLRLRFATSTLVSRWFTQMEPEIAGTNPNLIFNFDEIMVFAQSKCKVVTSCEKRPFKRKEIKTPHMTLGLCISPFGNGPPPFFVLSGIRDVSEFQGFHRDTLRVFSSQNGWMTGDLFRQWAIILVEWLDLYRIGLPQNIQNQTAVLLIDNCRTHCVYSALQIFAMHNCKVISFPPHMTHVMQPIDVACARAFKAALGKSIDHFRNHPEQLPMAKDSDASRTRTVLVIAALSALGNCTVEVCLNGYERCGIWPWSLEKVLSSPYVHESHMDFEVMEKMKKPGKFHSGSSVMTSHAFLNAINLWNSGRGASV
jgi:hypothetical protein